MEIRKPASQRATGAVRRKPVSKIAQKRVKRNKTRGVAAGIAAIILVVSLVLTSRLERLFIRDISVTGVRSEYAVALETQIKDRLEGSFLVVFPKKNIFLFQEKNLTEELLKNNSYLESITFKRRGLNILDVNAKERAPLFSVQGTAEANIFIDSFGVIYSDSGATLSTSTILLSETASHYGASSTGTLPIDILAQKGKPLPELYFKNLTKAIDLFKLKNFPVYRVTLRAYGDADIQITPEGGTIRINLYDDIEKSVATFSAARKIEPLRSKLNEQRSALKYIDLRFGNKVFYMFTPTS